MNALQQLSAHLDRLKSDGNYRTFLEIRRLADRAPVFLFLNPSGELTEAVNWTSNDYLGMSADETVRKRLAEIALEAGAGSGGTRNISGTSHFHTMLETTLAGWHTRERALLFGSAFQANVTAVSTLGRLIPELIIFSDEENHASLIEGIKLSGCRKHIFQHNDAAHLRSLLEAAPKQSPKLIVFESVYSISGNRAPLREFAALAQEFDALTYVDEVHAAGLYGKSGAGLLEEAGLSSKATLINGTLAKAVGVHGGYICGDALVVDAVRSFGTGFIFTSSLPPSLCAAAITAVQRIQRDAALRERLHDAVGQLRAALDAAGICYAGQDAHITPVQIGGSFRTKAVAYDLLHRHGMYLQPVIAPTVATGKECLRIVATARHIAPQFSELAGAMASVFEMHGIPRNKPAGIRKASGG
jgi:5-aminolevulinate synthase